MTTTPPITESQWQQQVIDLARLYGWLVHHCRPAQHQSGKWATPIQGDPGFPDLVLARGGRVIFAELKTDAAHANLTIHQKAWAAAIQGRFVEWYCWRPRNLPDVAAALAYQSSEIRGIDTVQNVGEYL
jgi:hypothetical protein